MFAIVSGMKLTKTKSKEKSFPRGEKKRVVSLMILRIFMFDKVSVFSKVVMKLTKTKSKGKSFLRNSFWFLIKLVEIGDCLTKLRNKRFSWKQKCN